MHEWCEYFWLYILNLGNQGFAEQQLRKIKQARHYELFLFILNSFFNGNLYIWEVEKTVKRKGNTNLNNFLAYVKVLNKLYNCKGRIGI